MCFVVILILGGGGDEWREGEWLDAVPVVVLCVFVCFFIRGGGKWREGGWRGCVGVTLVHP